MKFRKIIALIVAFAALFTLAACGSNGGNANTGDASGEKEVYELIVQNHDPATSICAKYLEAWGAKVTEASGGRIQFIFYHGGSLGGATETVDMVLNGQADIGWTASAINVGRFPCSDGICLPMMGFENTVEAAKTMWKMYETHDYISDEWKDFKVIQIAAACDVPITSNRKIETVEDFSGLRMRCVVPSVVYMLQYLGSVPMSITISDTYENLEKNVADGCMNDWHNIMAFSLWDVLDYAMDAKVSYSNQALLMNWDSYNELPDDLKAIIDEYSGEFAAIMAGEYWDSSIEQSRALAAEAGVEIYEASPEVQKALEEAAAYGWEKWAEDMNAEGYDGAQIVADFQAAMAEVQGG